MNEQWPKEQRAQEQRTNEQRAKESWTMDREDFLHHFEQVRERTMRVVSADPGGQGGVDVPARRVDVWRFGTACCGDGAVCICRVRFRAAEPV